MRIGVLGLQGDVVEHAEMLRKLTDEVAIVKRARDIKTIDGLIIPGGESTAIGKLIAKYNIDKAIKDENLAIFGTCAGAILLAREILGMQQFSLKLMDIAVERNAYGRQKESFEVDLKIPALGKAPFRAIFIRAPAIKKVGKNVEVLAEYDGNVVLARQGNLLVSTFHPELTEDSRVHEYFLKLIAGEV